jgi:hypothetical protein
MELGNTFEPIQIPPEGMERSPWAASGNPSKIDAAKIANLVVDTITVSTTGYIKSGKTSFTDDTNAGYYISADGVYLGSASDTTKLKYTIDTGAIDYKGSIDAASLIGGRLASTLASAIDASGHFADSAINTANKTILSDFTFGVSGALQVGTYVNGVSGDLKISPNGILARDNTGNTTFSINGTTGVAVLNGLVVGTNVGLGTAQDSAGVTTIIGNTVTTSFVNALNVNAATINASVSITTPTITGGTITIGTLDNVFKADSNGIYLGNATFADAPFRVDMNGNVTVKSLARDDFHLFTIFESLDGYTTSNDGAGTTITSGSGLIITTGTTTNDTSLIRRDVDGGLTWNKNRKFKCYVDFGNNSNQIMYIVTGDPSPATDRHFGFYVANTALYGTCGDGTYQNTVNLSVTASGSKLLEAFYDYINEEILFYVDGVYKGKLDANLPIGDTSSTWMIWAYVKNNNGADGAKTLAIRWWDFWQAN